MLSAVVTRSFSVTGGYKVNLNNAMSDEEVDAVAVLPYKGIDGESGVKYVHEVGSTVLVTQLETGSYCILGGLPASTERPDKKGKIKSSTYNISLNTRSSEFARFIGDTVYTESGESNYNGFEQQEQLPGDLVMKAAGGAAVRALRGGTAVLDADTARVVANKSTSSVDIDSYRFRRRTGIGDLVIEDGPSGNFFMDFRGNTNPNASSNNFCIRLEAAGDTPVFSMSLGEGYGISINSAGELTIRANKLLLDTGDKITELSSSSGKGITETSGDVNLAAETTTIQSEADTNMSSKGSFRLKVSGEVSDACGAFRSTLTSGPNPLQYPLLAVAPDTVQSRKDITASGSHAVEVGSLTSGGGSYSVNSFGGDLRLESKSAVSPLLGGSLVLSTTSLGGRTSGPFGVVVDSSKTIFGGGIGTFGAGVPVAQAAVPPAPGGLNLTMSGLCKFNALFTYIKALHVALDAHVHAVPPLPVGAALTSPGVTASTPTFSTLTPLAALIESQSVWNFGP